MTGDVSSIPAVTPVLGTPMYHKPIPTMTTEQEERFWAKVDVPYQPSCCWEWTAATFRGDYGQFKIGPLSYHAHRIAYALLIGPITQQIDHLCRNTKCVNPDHLEPVEPRVNALRGYNPAAQNNRKTHCKHGHPFNEANTYHDTNRNGLARRTCRKCAAERQRKQRAKHPPLT